MEIAVELCMTSKAFTSMCCNRLVVIVHEDIGLADPECAVYVQSSIPFLKDFQAREKGEYLLVLGNVIRRMCRAAKSREGDHFVGAVGVPILEGWKVPEIPDYAYDKHTQKGRAMGRGLKHFLQDGATLVPAPATADAYYEEAVTSWKRQIKERKAAKAKADADASDG